VAKKPRMHPTPGKYAQRGYTRKTYHMTPELHKQLMFRALEEDRAASAIVREAVQAYLQKPPMKTR
jgi:hypothetical protein